MDWISTGIGIVIGAMCSLIISSIYYKKSLKDQERLRNEDKKQRAIDQERLVLFSNRESNFEQYQRDPKRPWEITLNIDKHSLNEITLISRKETVPASVLVSIHVPNQKQIGIPFAFGKDVNKGDEIKVKLPNGLNEIDGLSVQSLYDSIYTIETEIVPIHPKYTMPDYRDPRLNL